MTKQKSLTLNFNTIIMKNIIIILVLFVSFLTSAQGNNEKGMQKAFELWGQNKPTEAVNLFERIANAESDNWLPPYWAAQINIVSSFGETDKDKLTAQLGKAQDLLNDATAISKDNPEIMIMQALLQHKYFSGLCSADQHPALCVSLIWSSLGADLGPSPSGCSQCQGLCNICNM